MRGRLQAGVVLLGTTGLLACLDGFGGGQSQSPPVEIAGAFLHGRIGTFDHVDQAADDTYLDDYGSFTSLQVNVDRSGEAAMVILDVQGGLGALVQRDIPSWTDGSTTPETVIVTGCSGQVRGDWAYDQEADSTQVRVLAGPTTGVRRLEFRSNFSHTPGVDAHQATGHVDVRVGGGDPDGAPSRATGTPVAVQAGNGSGQLGDVGIRGMPQAIVANDDGTGVVRVMATWQSSGRSARVTVAVLQGAELTGGSPGDAFTLSAVAAARPLDAPALDVRTVRSASETWYAFSATWPDGSALQASFALPR